MAFTVRGERCSCAATSRFVAPSPIKLITLNSASINLSHPDLSRGWPRPGELSAGVLGGARAEKGPPRVHHVGRFHQRNGISFQNPTGVLRDRREKRLFRGALVQVPRCSAAPRARNPASPPAEATRDIKISWSTTFGHSGVMTRVCSGR
jgi:hypothetical protein